MFYRLNKKGERLINLEKKPTKFRQFSAYLWRYKFVQKDKTQNVELLTFVRNGEFYSSSVAVRGKNPDAKTIESAHRS